METPRRQRKPKALRLHRAPPQSLPRAARWPQLQHLPKRPRQGLQAWERLRREEKASRTEPRNCGQGWSGLRPQTFDVQRSRTARPRVPAPGVQTVRRTAENGAARASATGDARRTAPGVARRELQARSGLLGSRLLLRRHGEEQAR